MIIGEANTYPPRLTEDYAALISQSILLYVISLPFFLRWSLSTNGSYPTFLTKYQPPKQADGCEYGGSLAYVFSSC